MTELDALRAAKLMLDAHGADTAERILAERTAADGPEHLAMTRRVQTALTALKDEGAGKTRQ